jgi:amidohydrolase
MDALSMDDGITAEYRSTRPGKAHKCGHDVHVATLLGCARLLAPRRHLFCGEARLVFQPGEETTGGAVPMIREGVADGIDAALSLHVMAYNPVGTVAVREGRITASEDDVHVTLRGRGGHCANPDKAINPVPVACSIISGLHSWLTRTVSPLKHCVLTVTHINGGSAQSVNVIPEICTFAFTFRTFDVEVRTMLQEGLPAFIKASAAAYGAEAEVVTRSGFSSGHNARFVVEAVRKCVTALYGESQLIDIPEPEMGAEDFYEFGLQGKVPVCQFWLGGANAERGITEDNHHPGFDVDEDCLPMGAATLAGTTLTLFAKIAKDRERDPGGLAGRLSAHGSPAGPHSRASHNASPTAFAPTSLVHQHAHHASHGFEL